MTDTLRPPPPTPLEEGLARIASSGPIARGGLSIPAAAAPMVAGPPLGLARAPIPIARGTLRRSLTASTAEGFFAEIVSACAGGAVLTGWGLHLGCSPFALGILSGLPFFGQLAHLPAAWIVAHFGRRRVCLVSVALSRQVLLALAFLPLLPVSLIAKQVLLLLIAATSYLLGMIGNNAWQAWMGDLVPMSLRGRYFGRRAAICTTGGVLASLVAGVLLDRARGGGWEARGLSVLAVIAAAAGMTSSLLMRRQQDPDRRRAPREISMSAAVAPFLDPEARRFLVYQAAFNASVGILGGFIAVHMLDHLRVGFTRLALHATLLAATRVVAAPFWGRAIDSRGAAATLIMATSGIAFLPAVWFFPTPEFLAPVVLDAVLAGLFWSGHGLAAFALPLGIAPPARRSYYLGAFTATGGIAFFLASTAGGAIVSYLPDTFPGLGRTWHAVHVLFAISCVARLSTAVLAGRVLGTLRARH